LYSKNGDDSIPNEGLLVFMGSSMGEESMSWRSIEAIGFVELEIVICK